jgi:hypothetical protein
MSELQVLYEEITMSNYADFILDALAAYALAH